MSFVMPEITYTYDWNIMDPTADGYLPTYEPDEAKVRADLQRPLDQIKDTWNGDLKTQLETFCNSFGGLIPAGVYDSTKSYDKLSLVWYNGSSYVAAADIEVGEVPGAPNSNWQLFGSTLNQAQQTGAVSAAGEAAVKTTVGSSASGQTITASLEGTGSLPLLTEAVRSALGLTEGKDKLADLLTILPTVRIGKLTVPTLGNVAEIGCPGRILLLVAKHDSRGDGAIYFFGGFQWVRIQAGANVFRYAGPMFPAEVTDGGKTVKLNRAELSSGDYTYFAVCEGYVPASQEASNE